MSVEYIEIGCTPYGEECLATGIDSQEHIRAETVVFKNQLHRVLAEAGKTCELKVKGFPHDFGTYYEVCAYYYDEETQEGAFWLESNCPENWDEDALDELKSRNIPAKCFRS